MKETAAAPALCEQKVLDQPSDTIPSESSHESVDNSTANDSEDDEPMIYTSPRDYATAAPQERDRLIASGTNPNSIILQSKVRNHVPPRENESPGAYATRYTETANAMIDRGVAILNDVCTADTVASAFSTADGRFFDLGPGSGVTKGEFREFSRWFAEMSEAGQTPETPEKWLKFETAPMGDWARDGNGNGNGDGNGGRRPLV